MHIPGGAIGRRLDDGGWERLGDDAPPGGQIRNRPDGQRLDEHIAQSGRLDRAGHDGRIGCGWMPASILVTNRGAVCKIGQVTACKCMRLGAQCAVYGERLCTELWHLRPVPRTIGSSLMHGTRSTQLRRAVAPYERG